MGTKWALRECTHGVQVLDCLRAIEKGRDAGLIDFHKPATRFSLDEYVHFEQVRI